MRGSIILRPSGCSTPSPCTMRSGNGVAALPMSICPQQMSYWRQSSEVDLVKPVTACLVEVYATENGRGACAEIEPLLMMRPPRGDWLFMILMAPCVHRNMPVKLVATTCCQVSNGRSSSGTGGAPTPALLNSTSSRPKVDFTVAKSVRIDSRFDTSGGPLSACAPMALIS